MSDNIKTKSVADVFERTECYSANVSELAGEMGEEFVDQDGDLIKFEFSTYIKLINLLWAKVKETAFECEGKTIQVNIPDTLPGQILKAALGIIGIRL